MSDHLDVHFWEKELGLLGIPMRSHLSRGNSQYVLLNGGTGNFCLGFNKEIGDTERRNNAWSTNVGHYVHASEDLIEVHRWDRNKSVFERYNSKSILKQLGRFHDYLEKNAPTSTSSIISHAIKTFRQLRDQLGREGTAQKSLEAFLVMLAASCDDIGISKVAMSEWGLNDSALEVANTIPVDAWNRLQKEFTQGRPAEELEPDLKLLLRHAAGQLFQEAHYEALYSSQLVLPGMPDSPLLIKKNQSAIGVHFTPPALARALVEQSIEMKPSIDKDTPLVIFDPACGSAEFLREALRQLERSNHSGKIHLIGWDISPAACDIARFVLANEEKYMTQNVSISIENRDSLDPDCNWPKADLLLMNPPYQSWQDMTEENRKHIESFLGNVMKGRPDLSSAFLIKASRSVNMDGVLGCIIPASILDGDSAATLRESIGNQLFSRFIARLGNHQLFSGATVDVALYIGTKSEADSYPPIALWADQRSSSSSLALRTLRKMKFYGENAILPAEGSGYSVYRNVEIGKGKSSWAPRSFKSWRQLDRYKSLKTVQNLFSVRQGVRTGNNPSFLIPKEEKESLSKEEQKYFLSAVINRSIRNGALKDTDYVFYPYGNRHIESEAELQKGLPNYYQQYLKPAKEKLINRAGIHGANWWQLTRHRIWQETQQQKIVSKYFGNAGSFAWDETGKFAVVQGYAWLPKTDNFTSDLGFAYSTILNSEFFENFLAAVSNNVGGGQWNLSTRFVNRIPLPDLGRDIFEPSIIADISHLGKMISKCESNDEFRKIQLKSKRIIDEIYRISLQHIKE